MAEGRLPAAGRGVLARGRRAAGAGGPGRRRAARHRRGRPGHARAVRGRDARRAVGGQTARERLSRRSRASSCPTSAAQAGLVLHNIGLTEQLRARLAELQASRLRIVAAQDDQRRRIERDIHDGAQQQLLAIARHAGAGRVAWPARTTSGSGHWSPGSGPRPAARWRRCANSPAASTRRCSPTRAWRAAVGAQATQGTRAGRGEYQRHRPVPAGDRDRHLLLLRGSAAERRPARAGFGGAGQPGRQRARPGVRSSPTTAPASTRPPSTAGRDCGTCATGWPRSAAPARSTPPPAGAPPSPGGSGWTARWRQRRYGAAHWPHGVESVKPGRARARADPDIGTAMANEVPPAACPSWWPGA